MVRADLVFQILLFTGLTSALAGLGFATSRKAIFSYAGSSILAFSGFLFSLDLVYLGAVATFVGALFLVLLLFYSLGAASLSDIALEPGPEKVGKKKWARQLNSGLASAGFSAVVFLVLRPIEISKQESVSTDTPTSPVGLLAAQMLNHHFLTILLIILFGAVVLFSFSPVLRLEQLDTKKASKPELSPAEERR